MCTVRSCVSVAHRWGIDCCLERICTSGRILECLGLRIDEDSESTIPRRAVPVHNLYCSARKTAGRGGTGDPTKVDRSDVRHY